MRKPSHGRGEGLPGRPTPRREAYSQGSPALSLALICRDKKHLSARQKQRSLDADPLGAPGPSLPPPGSRHHFLGFCIAPDCSPAAGN